MTDEITSGSWSDFSERASDDYGDNAMTQEPEDRKLDFSLPPRDRAITLKAPKSLIFLYVLVLLAILVDIGLDMGFSPWTPESPRSATTEGSSLSPTPKRTWR